MYLSQRKSKPTKDIRQYVLSLFSFKYNKLNNLLFIINWLKVTCLLFTCKKMHTAETNTIEQHYLQTADESMHVIKII